MDKFLVLEGGNLVIAAFFMLIMLFVTTRPFMGKSAFVRGMGGITGLVVVLISLHFNSTSNRMAEVREAFMHDGIIICESRALRKAAQSINIQKSKEWFMEGDNFVSPNYSRAFHSARCIVK